MHRPDKKRVIFKSGPFTVTLYNMPKVDLKSKIHIQSGDQQANMEFIMDKLSAMYQEVITLENQPIFFLMIKQMEKSVCGQCGKQFTNKKGVKQHMQRMHTTKKANKSNVETITLEETVQIGNSPPKNISQKPVSNVIVRNIVLVEPRDVTQKSSHPNPKKIKINEVD